MAENQDTTREVIFKPIPDFPGYDVSNFGKVRSYYQKGQRSLSDVPKRVLKPIIRGGYPRVTLFLKDRRYHFCIHTLMLLAFIGPCPPGHECRHLDGNPANNFLGNLCWGTHSENMVDRTKHGTWENRGMKCPTAKLSDDQALIIRHIYAQNDYSHRNLGKIFGVSESTIRRVVNRKTWQHI